MPGTIVGRGPLPRGSRRSVITGEAKGRTPEWNAREPTRRHMWDQGDVPLLAPVGLSVASRWPPCAPSTRHDAICVRRAEAVWV
jgi:hypothetical protein